MTRDDAFTDAIRTEPELQAAGDALADLPSPVPVSPALKNSVLAAVAETPQDNVTSIASRRRPTPRFLTIAAACLAIASVGIGATVLWSGSKEESGGNGASISAEQAGTREMPQMCAAPTWMPRGQTCPLWCPIRWAKAVPWWMGNQWLMLEWVRKYGPLVRTAPCVPQA